MAYISNKQFEKRLKSFLWRLGAMVFVEVGNFGIILMTDNHSPQYLIIILGLLVGEVTKYLNNNKKKNG